MPEVMEEERERLRWTRDAFLCIIGEAREMYDALPGLYRDNPDLLGDLMLQTHNRIARLEAGREKPYFARIDFTDASGVREQCYLSKVGVSDRENRLVTVDWRAPVASLYYESNVGRARYEAPGGPVEGTLELKRQIEIERGELQSVRDVDTVIDDELLMPYLGVGADNRLKNIVASIQGEQNRIIREKIERTLVVQGAAGSGKTTVALHRIAYLAYTYRESIRNSQYMVIGPNPVFLRYISSVLPDLDVDRVPQYTFDSLATEIIGERYTLTDRYDRLYETLAGKKETGLERWKTSMRCRDALDRFLRRFEEGIVPEGGFSVHGFEILSAGEVHRTYAAAAGDGTILAHVERTVLMLGRLIRQRQPLLEEQLSLFFRERYRAAGDEKDLARLHRERAAAERELETGCRRTLRAHFSGVDIKLLALYRQFLSEGDFGPEYPCPDAKASLSALRRRVLSPEDLASVLYLCERVRGCPAYAQYRHAIVDEAQDYGEFELYVLRRILSGSSFTVVGDLAQSIFGYRSIESWEPVLRDALPGAKLYEVSKSYRTTVEIMEAANTVSAFLGLTPAEPVIRHGEPVGLHEASAFAGLVRARREDGYQSVAVITRTPEEAVRALGELHGQGIEAASPGDESGADPGDGARTVVLTACQAKGLEFDAAILCNVSAYDASSRTDMHLLYVAMTRPLHRLDLLYEGDICAPLRSLPAACRAL